MKREASRLEVSIRAGSFQRLSGMNIHEIVGEDLSEA